MHTGLYIASLICLLIAAYTWFFGFGKSVKSFEPTAWMSSVFYIIITYALGGVGILLFVVGVILHVLR